MLRIDIAEADRIATLTLDRPEKRNALSLEFMSQLTCALADIGERSDVGVVILAANGPVFSSGHDLSELVDRSARDYQREADELLLRVSDGLAPEEAALALAVLVNRAVTRLHNLSRGEASGSQ